MYLTFFLLALLVCPLASFFQLWDSDNALGDGGEEDEEGSDNALEEEGDDDGEESASAPEEEGDDDQEDSEKDKSGVRKLMLNSGGAEMEELEKEYENLWHQEQYEQRRTLFFSLNFLPIKLL